jgi:hypothetical protein
MNVEIGTEAAQFPEKEYINGIFLAVYCSGDAIYCTLYFLCFTMVHRLENGTYHRIAVG